MKHIFNLFFIIITIGLLYTTVAANASDTSGAEIRLQQLTMKLSHKSQVFSEALLPGEIADIEVNHIILAGPFSQVETLSKTQDAIFIFIKGPGILKAGDRTYNINPECIALPTSYSSIRINVAEGDTLHYVKIEKKLSPQDLEDIKALPSENRNGIYFAKFDDCKAYTEKIKSPNTVSRTVLPKDYIPRVAMGTVETIGPDEVGAHEHPMLDQLFLGLARNDAIVYADDRSVHFTEYTILHIPIGSSHWVTVDEGKKMYYQWMDFFISKEGEEWLKTHKSIDEYKKK
jgi:mannose-6-phosphate isomerase-like protein (cupin superfamily)